MGRRVGWRRAAGALALCAAACAPRSLPSPRPSLLGPVVDASGAISPARWRFHPATLPAPLASVAVGDETLVVGAHGERWLLGKHAVAAAVRAPEALVGVQPGGAGWLFLGESGTTYEAEEPLGTFLRSAAPAVPLHGVSATSRAILGIRAGGRLTRSADLGRSWADAGPPGLLVADAALEPGGRGLALAIPERLLFTDDHGATWAPLDAPTVGALAIDARQSRLSVAGALGAYALTDAPAPALTPFAGKPARAPKRTSARPARGPDATAIAAGSAIVTGGRYLEIVTASSGKGGLALLAGPLEGPLRRRSIDAGTGCRAARIAANGPHLELSCTGDVSPSAATAQVAGPGVLSFWRSQDGGAKWQRESFVARGNLGALRMAVGPAGELLVSGVCAGEARAGPCKAHGIHVRKQGPPPERATKPSRTRRAGEPRSSAPPPSAHLAAAVAPSLRRAPLSLAFGPTGRAYALGRRTKGGDLAVFVSQDGGRTFAAHDLVERSASAGGEPDTDQSRWNNDGDDDDNAVVESFAVGDDGMIALVIRRWGALTYWVLDAEGRSIATTTGPEDTDTLGACGRRGLALSTADGTTWETLDGGVSWQHAGRWPTRACQIAVAGGEDACSVTVACSPSGCVLGDELTRLGWGTDPGALDIEAPPLPEPPVARPAPPPRTPISCALGAEPWRVLDHATTLPDATEAAIGDVAWFLPAEDDKSGKAGVWNATGGAKARVEYVPLLGPLPRPREYAQLLSPQVEGAAALRFRLPTPQDPRLGAIEVAWQNLFERRVVRTSLGRSVPYRPGDYQRAPGTTERATPALLSIASHGIYLQLHGATGTNQPAYFLDGRNVEEVPPLAWPGELTIRGRTEIAHLDGHVPFVLVDGGSVLVRATRTGDSWSFGAIALGPADPESLGLAQQSRIAYQGANVGIAVQITDEATGRTQAWLHPIAAQGAVTLPPIPLPWQGSLAEPPAPCSPQDRASSPRSIAPATPGKRHPVIVSDAREPLRLLATDDAVLHGTPDRPCVAAFHAIPTPPARAEADLVSAILPMGDLEHAWLFRPIAVPPNGSGVEYRPMACRFDPGAELPDDTATTLAPTP